MPCAYQLDLCVTNCRCFHSPHTGCRAAGFHNPVFPSVGRDANFRPHDVWQSLGVLLLFLPPDGVAVQTAANEANAISFKKMLTRRFSATENDLKNNLFTLSLSGHTVKRRKFSPSTMITDKEVCNHLIFVHLKHAYD